MSEDRVGSIIHRFHVIVDELPGLRSEDVENVEDLIRAGEWTVAFENLCTQLYEYDVAIPPATLVKISELGRDVGASPRYWQMLSASDSV
jgi:hypothetical protein